MDQKVARLLVQRQTPVNQPQHELLSLMFCSNEPLGSFRVFVKHEKQLHPQLYLVGGVVRAGLLHLHQDEGVQEVGGDHVWDKRCCLLLKHERHDVISYVAFPLKLKNVTQQLVSDQRDDRQRELSEQLFATRMLCTCCESPSVKGSLVDTWNMISCCLWTV